MQSDELLVQKVNIIRSVPPAVCVILAALGAQAIEDRVAETASPAMHARPAEPPARHEGLEFGESSIAEATDNFELDWRNIRRLRAETARKRAIEARDAREQENNVTIPPTDEQVQKVAQDVENARLLKEAAERQLAEETEERRQKELVEVKKIEDEQRARAAMQNLERRLKELADIRQREEDELKRIAAETEARRQKELAEVKKLEDDERVRAAMQNVERRLKELADIRQREEDEQRAHTARQNVERRLNELEENRRRESQNAKRIADETEAQRQKELVRAGQHEQDRQRESALIEKAQREREIPERQPGSPVIGLPAPGQFVNPQTQAAREFTEEQIRRARERARQTHVPDIDLDDLERLLPPVHLPVAKPSVR